MGMMTDYAFDEAAIAATVMAVVAFFLLQLARRSLAEGLATSAMTGLVAFGAVGFMLHDRTGPMPATTPHAVAGSAAK
jgi:hypothetical protein